MNKLTKSFIVASLASSLLSAEMVLIDHDFDKEFNKMQNFVNSVMSRHMSNSYFNNAYPQVDMQDMKTQYLITYNVAGINKKDISLSLSDDNILTIKGERKSANETKNESYVKQESFYGKFERSMKLPQDADSTTLKTEYENGLLKVTITKKEIKKNFKIIPIN